MPQRQSPSFHETRNIESGHGCDQIHDKCCSRNRRAANCRARSRKAAESVQVVKLKRQLNWRSRFPRDRTPFNRADWIGSSRDWPLGTSAGTASTADQEPLFTSDGQLLNPKDYRDWVFLSAGLGMTYGPRSGAGATAENARFENVFVNPPAYRSFLNTGTWPDNTILVLEICASVSKLSINKNGRVQ
jgi:hypothetical protein